MGRYKTAVTARINNLRHSKGAKVWHRGYYERISRNERELQATRKYIIDNPLKEKFVHKFKNDCLKKWDENQKILSEFLKVEYVLGGEKIKNFFGQYKQHPKEWFLDPFDPNVSLDRSEGRNYGEDQIISKRKNILEKIDSFFDETKGDKEIIIKDLNKDLSDIFDTTKEAEYFLFYNTNLGREIYNIPNLEWKRQDWEVATLKINKIHINFYPINIKTNLLLKKSSFLLKQYKQGYEKRDKALVRDVEELNKDDIKKIQEQNKDKKIDEIKQNIKIRVAEKYDIERINKNIIIRILN